MLHVDTTTKLQQARQSRRESRRQLYQACLSDAVTAITQEAGGSFADRTADLWGMHAEEKGCRRKISGHPGAAASLYVSETFGEYNVPGTLRCYYGGMQREAGRGAHGITEGTILVSVELSPMDGMKQLLDVPVTVKNGYMLQPGLFLNHGVPYVLAQSSLDDLIKAGSFDPEIKPDRKNMFSPPRTAAVGVQAKTVAPQRKDVRSLMPKKDYEQAKSQQDDETASADAKAKEQCKRRRHDVPSTESRVLAKHK